jgi:hypothetical protein
MSQDQWQQWAEEDRQREEKRRQEEEGRLQQEIQRQEEERRRQANAWWEEQQQRQANDRWEQQRQEEARIKQQNSQQQQTGSGCLSSFFSFIVNCTIGLFLLAFFSTPDGQKILLSVANYLKSLDNEGISSAISEVEKALSSASQPSTNSNSMPVSPTLPSSSLPLPAPPTAELPPTNQPSSSGGEVSVSPTLPSSISSPFSSVLPEWPKNSPSNDQPSTGQSSPSSSFYAAIGDKISGGTVEYSSDTSKIAGNVQRVWEQNKTQRDESGIACQIKWNDGITSRMLFLDGSRVRVWSFGNEYGGRWEWDDGTLYVKMDAGGFYRFR